MFFQEAMEALFMGVIDLFALLRQGRYTDADQQVKGNPPAATMDGLRPAIPQVDADHVKDSNAYIIG
jgi:hypothetical protein